MLDERGRSSDVEYPPNPSMGEGLISSLLVSIDRSCSHRRKGDDIWLLGLHCRADNDHLLGVPIGLACLELEFCSGSLAISENYVGGWPLRSREQHTKEHQVYVQKVELLSGRRRAGLAPQYGLVEGARSHSNIRRRQ